MKFAIILAGAGLALAPAAASAQPSGAANSAAAQQLGNCLVLKSTGLDRLTFMQWMVAALASTPRLKDVAAVDAARKAQLDKQVAGIMTRLLTVDCLTESKAVAKDNDDTGFRIAGEALGRIAFQELFADPDAERAMSGYAQYIRQEDFAALRK